MVSKSSFIMSEKNQMSVSYIEDMFKMGNIFRIFYKEVNFNQRNHMDSKICKPLKDIDLKRWKADGTNFIG